VPPGLGRGWGFKAMGRVRSRARDAVRARGEIKPPPPPPPTETGSRVRMRLKKQKGTAGLRQGQRRLRRATNEALQSGERRGARGPEMFGSTPAPPKASAADLAPCHRSARGTIAYARRPPRAVTPKGNRRVRGERRPVTYPRRARLAVERVRGE